MNVSGFLSKTKHLFNELIKHRIVIGNQSADLDSIVSAIAMSYYLSVANENATFIPVINSTKSVLQTKKECMYLFGYFKVNLDDLVFISECHGKDISEVVLVDHNELDEQEKSLGFANLVSSIIDHHLDKKLFMNATPRLIDLTAGSNATLIANLFYESKLKMNDSFATMLQFPILADTDNLTRRTSQKDLEMHEFLNSMSQIDSNLVFKNIDELKNDQSDVGAAMLIQKDYRQYCNANMKWGMSSITLCAHELLMNEAKFLDHVKQFMHERNLSFYGVLSNFKVENNQTRRDLILFTYSEPILNAFNATQNKNLTLLKTLNERMSLFYSVYDVNDSALTRKYWQPVLESFLEREIDSF